VTATSHSPRHAAAIDHAVHWLTKRGLQMWRIGFDADGDSTWIYFSGAPRIRWLCLIVDDGGTRTGLVAFRDGAATVAWNVPRGNFGLRDFLRRVRPFQ
jgi:hypothetical protein